MGRMRQAMASTRPTMGRARAVSLRGSAELKIWEVRFLFISNYCLNESRERERDLSREKDEPRERERDESWEEYWELIL